MTTSKHFKELPEGVPQPPSDLEQNPGIGQSRGAYRSGGDPADIAGESTVKGDVGNGTKPDGGLAKREEARTNE